MSGNGILSLNITDKAVLYAAYMPFLQSGGIFVPTNKSFDIGAEVFMLITLPDESEKLPVAGKVIWITPARALGTRVRGVGIQFNELDSLIKNRIEDVLAGLLGSNKPTHTM